MNSSFFIERPVFSAVISILIVLVGGIAIVSLPIEQYPDITPPMVKITASYPGANSTTVTEALATPLEQEINGSPGMIYMESTSSNSGGLSISVTFDVGVDPDMAAVDVQNRVKLAESRLPAEVLQSGIVVEKQAPSQLMTVALTSSDPKYDEIYLSNYATINLINVIKRIPGVGRVSNMGSRYYAMMIWVSPEKLANYGLTVSDLSSAIKDQNRESAAGELGIQPMDDIDVTMPIITQGRLEDAIQFENIIIRTDDNGAVVRMKDVARVNLESNSYRYESGLDGGNAAMLGVFLLPGANALEVSSQVRGAMETVSKSFPRGLDYSVPFDLTNYIKESISGVYQTLFEAILLVIIVVFFSLQTWRSTIIPVIVVPISLIGTFAVMLVFGFSLNILTLLGLILAIGIVVDDAIVVVENVERIMEEDSLSAREASHKAMKELSGALVSTSLVLSAVFVPVSFLGGITGALFRQFSVTIAVSVLISTIIALTLTPALTAILLKPKAKDKAWIFKKIDDILDKTTNGYVLIIEMFFKNHKRVFLGFGLIFIMIIGLVKLLPTSFIPQEDQGFFLVEVEMPAGTTLPRTAKVVERVQKYFHKRNGVAHVQTYNGASPRIGGNEANSTLTIILDPWGDRSDDDQSLEQIIEDAKLEFNTYPEAILHIFKPPVIPGLGMAGGFEFKLQNKGGNSWKSLVDATDTLLLKTEVKKELENVNTSLQTDIPQLYFDLDREKAKFLGIPLADIFQNVKAFLGSMYVNDFNMFNLVYKVYIQADEEFRKYPSDLDLFYIKTESNTMVPISALGKTSFTTGPGSITRFNMFTTSTITGSSASGYSSGDAMLEMEKIVSELPEGIGYEWSGMSYQEKKASGQLGPIMILVLLFVFLFLAAQYESWSVPIAVLLTLPIAIFGAFLGVWVMGMENDIYFQIGLVTLIGLAAKNAILIVEFAKEKHESGTELVEAAIYASKLRFRPIVMTSLAFILGMIPMVIASGAGSAARKSIGTGVFFGMLVATSLGITLIPFLYVYVIKFSIKIEKFFSKLSFKSKSE